MQKFFTDKTKLFECNISVDGANINETKARLILEFPNKRNLLFYGDIDTNGKCKVVIPALKEMNECEGTVLLEVIAESTHFESWRDKFQLETNKKVQVEMVESQKEVIIENTKPRVAVIVDNVVEINPTYKKFDKFVNENKININSVMKNKTEFFNTLYEFKNRYNASKEDVVIIVEELKKVANSNEIQNLLNS
jgi:hypothetical protein